MPHPWDYSPGQYSYGDPRYGQHGRVAGAGTVAAKAGVGAIKKGAVAVRQGTQAVAGAIGVEKMFEGANLSAINEGLPSHSSSPRGVGR